MHEVGSKCRCSALLRERTMQKEHGRHLRGVGWILAIASTVAVAALTLSVPTTPVAAAGTGDDHWSFDNQFAGESVTYPFTIAAESVLADLDLPSDAVTVHATSPDTTTGWMPQIFY